MGQRLRKLCSLLDISDELRVKIWTVFERSLIHWADLMMDRHLDQFLMCAIYITAKVGLIDQRGMCSFDKSTAYIQYIGMSLPRGH